MEAGFDGFFPGFREKAALLLELLGRSPAPSAFIASNASPTSAATATPAINSKQEVKEPLVAVTDTKSATTAAPNAASSPSIASARVGLRFGRLFPDSVVSIAG